MGMTPALAMQDMGANPVQEESTPQQPDPTNLPRKMWYPLYELLMTLERNDDVPRREEVKKILQRRLFFRSQQDWYWDEGAGCYYPPSTLPVGAAEAGIESRSLRYPVNIIQPTSLSLSSVITQNNCRTQFYPRKASNQKDVATANQASKVAEDVQRKNDWGKLCDDCGYFMATDGFFAGYVRYISDSDRFGSDSHDILAAVEVPVGPPMVGCTECDEQELGTTEQVPVCPQCNAPMVNLPPMTATVPQTVGTLNIPRGQEVVTIIPALQMRRTAMADDQSEMLYMDWVTDIDKSVVMATYPEKEAELNSSSTGDDSGTASSYERIARRLLYLNAGRYTGEVLDGLGTFRRAWIRPKAFYRIQDKDLREQYLQMFPKGVRLVFYNDVYCESQPEAMDEKIESMHTMPGEGQIRETLISAIMPVQEMLNDCIDLLFDICMNGVPEGFAASGLIDPEARDAQGNMAGNVTPIELQPNEDIRSKMYFTQAVSPSAAMMQFIQWLMNEIPQLLSGNYPALSGGDTGGNDTAQGIAIQRNQAMGRIGRVWRRFQNFLSNLNAKAVKCVAENRQDDLEIPKQGESGDYQSDFISIQDLQGEIIAFPETDAQFPVMEQDVRSLLLTLFNSGNPLFIGPAATPENLEYIFRMLGIKDIQVPGEQQRKKTYGDIQQLVQAQPIVQQGPDGKPQEIPSLQPDPDVDDLNVAGKTAKDWLISDEGLKLAQENSPGYENVKAYAKACTQLGMMEAFRKAVATQSLQDSGPMADPAGANAMQPPPHQTPEKKSSEAGSGAPE